MSFAVSFSDKRLILNDTSLCLRVLSCIAVVLLCLSCGGTSSEKGIAPTQHGPKGAILIGVLEQQAGHEEYRQYWVQLGEGKVQLKEEHEFRGPADEALRASRSSTGSIGGDCRKSEAISPDAMYLARCEQGKLSHKEQLRKVRSYEFLVLDAGMKKEVVRRKLESSSVIDGIYWSPDSRAVAILYHSERTGIGPLDLLAALSGHPVPYYNFYVRVFGVKELFSVEFLIEKDCQYGWGQILDWQLE